MSTTVDLVERYFHMPGRSTSADSHLLAQAAAAHAKALFSDAIEGRNPQNIALDSLRDFLRGPAAARTKRRLLDHPVLVDALHTLGAGCPDLNYHCLPTLDAARLAPHALRDLGHAKLGNATLGLILHSDCQWCGVIDLCSDAFGDICFPGTPWSILLREQTATGVALRPHQVVRLKLGMQHARFYLAEMPEEDFLVLPRGLFTGLVRGNLDFLDSSRIEHPHCTLQPLVQCAVPLGNSGVWFESMPSQESDAHADTTGGILRALLEAMLRHAPGIYAELCTFIGRIRGFELAAVEQGTLESFSMPSAPGVMGFNVVYTDGGQPCLDPFCFTWLGHELGHTLYYLIEDVAYLHQWRFLHNPDELSQVIPRYGRSLRLGTLFQVPYVHLYEWILLMEFLRGDFEGLPWRMAGDPIAFGDDLRDEIEEAFDSIHASAETTSLGQAVLAHIHCLHTQATKQWQALRGAA